MVCVYNAVLLSQEKEENPAVGWVDSSVGGP